jgi:hypothetical protein
VIDLLELRSRLETALSEELGTYTFTNGTITPAMSVDYGNASYPPAGTAIDGLECVLIFRPEVPLRPFMGGAYEETYAVQIFLKQWNASKDTLVALGLILDAIGIFPDIALQSNSIRRVIPLSQLGNIETLQMTLTQSFLRESNHV